MDFVRCPSCRAPLSRKSGACHRCGQVIKANRGVTFGDVGATIKAVMVWLADALYKMTAWLDVSPKPKTEPEKDQVKEPDKVMTAAEFEQALNQRDKDKEPVRCAWLGCLFAVIGTFVLALVFVPLAVLFTGAGLIGSVIRVKAGAFLVSLLAVVLTCLAIVTSPSILLLIGLSSQ